MFNSPATILLSFWIIQRIIFNPYLLSHFVMHTTWRRSYLSTLNPGFINPIYLPLFLLPTLQTDFQPACFIYFTILYPAFSFFSSAFSFIVSYSMNICAPVNLDLLLPPLIPRLYSFLWFFFYFSSLFTCLEDLLTYSVCLDTTFLSLIPLVETLRSFKSVLRLKQRKFAFLSIL